MNSSMLLLLLLLLLEKALDDELAFSDSFSLRSFSYFSSINFSLVAPGSSMEQLEAAAVAPASQSQNSEEVDLDLDDDEDDEE